MHVLSFNNSCVLLNHVMFSPDYNLFYWSLQYTWSGARDQHLSWRGYIFHSTGYIWTYPLCAFDWQHAGNLEIIFYLFLWKLHNWWSILLKPSFVRWYSSFLVVFQFVVYWWWILSNHPCLGCLANDINFYTLKNIKN